jgi:HPt (histidine-containing phosphotransfer) domain-containing protein
VHYLSETDFDVVLMDVRMPGMDGLEATRRIRAIPGLRGHVPIVALTAQAFTEQIAACRTAGMDSHLSKPFDPETLLAAVTQAFTKGQTTPTLTPMPTAPPPSTPASSVSPSPVPPSPVPPSSVPPPSVPPSSVPRSSVSAASVSPPSSVPQPSAPWSPDPASSLIGFDLPIVDRTAFDRTASFLPPETVTTYLRTIVELGDGLLTRLRMPDAITLSGSELADTVHGLAGSSGMLGFERLSSIGRRFERAVQTASAETPVIGAGLIAALEATLQAIHEIEPAAATTEAHT